MNNYWVNEIKGWRFFLMGEEDIIGWGGGRSNGIIWKFGWGVYYV